MEEKELFWQELLEYIRHYGGLDEKTFEAFVSSADIMELTENSFKLRVPNSLIRNFWEQGKLKNVVVDFSLSTFGRQYLRNLEKAFSRGEDRISIHSADRKDFNEGDMIRTALELK